MSIIHLQRITNAIEKLFTGRLDLADLAGRPSAEKDAFLSRGLAAYCLMILTDADEVKAAEAITDGFDDNGIDAIYFDRPNAVLYIVQSTWSKSGKGSIDQEHSRKFIGGFHDLVNLRLERFNNRIRRRELELREALYSSDVSFVLVLAHTGTDKLSRHVQGDIDGLLGEMNTPDAVVAFEVFDQKRIYDAVAGYAQRHSITLEIMLQEWGFVKEPYRAYYGQVDAQSIADWWMQHGRLLFTRNIRNFKGSTDVNESLTQTLREFPDRFWYFNNGITVLCSKIAKKRVGGPSRESGLFECEGVNIVNGAQTVGIIGTLAQALNKESDNARVLVRLISLEDCPAGFEKEVTRATNTQNRIERRDFAALDPNQQRLASEFLLDGKYYAYKSGDEEPPTEKGCSIVDATVALACANGDVTLSGIAKREVGRLWDNIEEPPYTLLFNENTNSLVVWRAVEIMRMVEATLKDLGPTEPPRGDMVAVHGNRLVLYCVFQSPRIKVLADEHVDFDGIKTMASEVTKDVFVAMARDVETHYESSYLATLFKNQNKCHDIADRLLAQIYQPAKKTDTPVEPKGDNERSLFDLT